MAGTPSVEAAYTVVVLSALIFALICEARASCLTVPTTNLSVGREPSVSAVFLASYATLPPAKRTSVSSLVIFFSISCVSNSVISICNKSLLVVAP